MNTVRRLIQIAENNINLLEAKRREILIGKIAIAEHHIITDLEILIKNEQVIKKIVEDILMKLIGDQQHQGISVSLIFC